MVVHNLAEYVAYHQAKLREEHARNNPQPAKKYGVNPIRSKSSYTSSIVQGPADKLIVLDCFATWCGPCKVIAPEVLKFSNSEQYKDKVDFYKVDVDEVPDVAQELGVRAMPTFMFFKNGEKVDEVVGANVRALEAAIQKHI
ncbi:thioredoxin [Cladophialophora carrionii CBS 160.54]|uniref:Thioredoxin n=1 Tax=Cladophialophora carrionii CBS 160.54 TaxID=1279043 RepID=V9D322_9EURO|nr:thioredoxin [Cladophialophora carrionii CBS 160.54]ETI21314.1 thioredoxin [Cladophialophora carrionii CBS 160.54]